MCSEIEHLQPKRREKLVKIYDKVQERDQKTMSFEDKIHGSFNIKVIKLLQIFILQLIKFSIKINHCFWHFDFGNGIFLQLYTKKKTKIAKKHDKKYRSPLSLIKTQ